MTFRLRSAVSPASAIVANGPPGWARRTRTVLAGLVRIAARAATGAALASTIWSASSWAAPVQATPTNRFLDSIGVVSTFPNRGQPLAKTIEMIRYCGFRWVRAGIEGLTLYGPTTLQTFIDLHRETGARLSWGLVSGGNDLPKLIETGRVLASHGALLAFEGNNEPNNWGVTYQGLKGGGREPSWLAVAKLQRDLYRAVKSDPLLAAYPVWSISEPGAQADNVGLQFLTIPPGAGTLMPDGTQYADYANVHNYVFHPNSPDPADNKTWDAADTSPDAKVDGLFGNFGRTWGKGFKGYAQNELDALPRVTTETGVTIDGKVSERLQGLTLLNLYLSQFKRGYAHTSVYILRDRTDEAGNQSFGFFRPNYTPRLAATYLRNLTTILADRGRSTPTGSLDYAIAERPQTVHDLLLQHSDGSLQLVVWGERLEGESRIVVRFKEPQKRVEVYDPLVGTKVIDTVANAGEVAITVSDHPVVLKIASPDGRGH